MKLLLLFSVLVLSISTITIAQTVKLTKGEKAPEFNTKDVRDNAVRLSDYKGQKVLVTFYRNVGCPVCNLRFHELQEQALYLKEKNVVLLSVYESTTDHMKDYLGDETYYSTMIANPTQDLYALYRIERSTGKMMKGMFHGAMGKASRGKKLFKKEINQDGNTNRIGADFLIDENGLIIKAHYGRYVGDHLQIDEIKELVK